MDFDKLFNDLAIKAENLDLAMKILAPESTSDDENCQKMKILDNDLKDVKDLESMVS